MQIRLDASKELDNLLKDYTRKIVISENYVYLTSNQPNKLYVIVVAEGLGAAGGRAGGFGHRVIERLYCFRYDGANWQKLIQIDSQEYLSEIDIPPGIARLPARLLDGTEEVVYGMVDPEALKMIDIILGID
ncbi:MAG: hypothetical protein QXG05_05140 [Nitrososphaerota archaeon]